MQGSLEGQHNHTKSFIYKITYSVVELTLKPLLLSHLVFVVKAEVWSTEHKDEMKVFFSVLA